MSPAARGAFDRRWLFAALAALMAVALLAPLRVAPRPSPATRGFHDAIARVPRGATVVVACDFDPGAAPELAPMARTALRQLFERDCRVVVVGLWSGGPGIADRLLREAAFAFPDRRDGVDFVNLGYRAGNEAVMVLMAGGFAAAFPADLAGRPAADLPILERARSWSDVALLVSLSAGYPGTREWLQQVQARFHVPVAAGATGAVAPDLRPYLQSRQLLGLLDGMPGAAEYERLRGEDGPASRGMGAQSLGHAFVALCLVLGVAAGRAPARREGA